MMIYYYIRYEDGSYVPSFKNNSIKKNSRITDKSVSILGTLNNNNYECYKWQNYDLALKKEN